MARPKQPLCPRCLELGVFRNKEKNAGYCAEHRREYQKARYKTKTAEKELAYIFEEDKYEPPADLVQEAKADAEQVRQAARSHATIKDVVYELMEPIIQVIARHNEAMFKELGALIDGTLREYLDAASGGAGNGAVGASISRVVREEPDPLLRVAPDPEPNYFERYDPSSDEFDMPDNWAERGRRLGPPE